MTEIYRRAWRYALMCPLLFLLPALVEMVQHIVEYRGGFYDSIAAMKAAEGSPARMIAGHFKVFALFLTGYWVVRFHAFGEDPRAARGLEPRAVGLFVPVMLWGLMWLVLLQDGPLLAAAWGLPHRSVAIALVLLLVGSMAFEVCLNSWKAAAAVGNGAIGFGRSIALTRGRCWWALGITLATVLPPMVVHYALAFAALGRSPAWTVAVLAADSLLVAGMGALMATSTFVIARRIGERHGLALLPDEPGPQPSLSHAANRAVAR